MDTIVEPADSVLNDVRRRDFGTLQAAEPERLEQASCAAAPKLRIGLFADTPFQSRWIADALVMIAASDFAEVVLFGESGALEEEAPVLLRAYRAFDARRYAPRNDLSERLDLRPYFPDAALTMLPASGAGEQRLRAWRAEMEALRLDVAFVLGPVEDALLEGLARHGIWRYCFGEEHHTDEAIAGYHEVAQGRPVTGSGLLVRWRAGGGDQLVVESWSRTIAHSVAQNRNNCLRKTSQFAHRVLRELHRHGPQWFEKDESATKPVPGNAPAKPRNAEVLGHAAGIGLAILKRRLTDLCWNNQWYIGYGFDEDGPWLADLDRYHRLMPPRDRYWADPCPYEREGRHFIFFEEIQFGRGHGYISVVEVDPGGRSSEPRPVLQRDYHLSYPNLIEDEGALFLVPETGQHRTVEIYRCLSFPDRWQLEKVLLNGLYAVDPTFHHDGERWWMFAVVSVPGADSYDELHLFHAERLLGEWQPHPRNPVKSDVRSARPAGRLFRRGATLYRPAQVCAPRYGASVSINQVVRLDPGAYAEVEVGRVLPPRSQGAIGLHTVNRDKRLSVYDAIVPRWRRAPFGRRGS